MFAASSWYCHVHSEKLLTPTQTCLQRTSPAPRRPAELKLSAASSERRYLLWDFTLCEFRTPSLTCSFWKLSSSASRRSCGSCLTAILVWRMNDVRSCFFSARPNCISLVPYPCHEVSRAFLDQCKTHARSLVLSYRCPLNNTCHMIYCK